MLTLICWLIFYIALITINCLIYSKTDLCEKYKNLYDEYNKYKKNK